jgi:hypothetical protein
MKKILSLNWALGWRRTFWTASFTAFLALIVYMAKDMADSQPVVFGVIVLSAVVGAVAFVYALSSKEALLIAVLAMGIHVFLDASYWSSVIDAISTQVMREQSAAASRDVVNEKRRARYAASASGKGADQLAAEIEALKQDTRWTTSEQCSKATAPASRAFCQDYYRVVAEHAAAKEASNLEQTVFHTTVEATDLPRNLAKGAIWVSDVTGMSVQTATNILVALMVLFIQAGLAGSLRIGWQPVKPAEALTAPKDDPVSLVGAGRFPATPEPRAPLPHPAEPWASEAEVQKLRDLVADMKAHGIAPPLRGEEPSPIGGGSGSRAPEPAIEVATEEAPATEEMAPDPKIVRPAQWHEDSTPPVAPRTNGRRGKKDPTKHLTRKDQIVIQWLADSCSITGDEADVATGGACHTSYRQYCDGRRVPQKDRVAQARMSAILSGQLGTRVNGRGKRNGKEAEFPGLLINPIVAQRARRYA